MFHHNSFNPVSFSIQSFKMAQEDQGRSGYWRLFFYKMQEEALKKDQVKEEVLETEKLEKLAPQSLPARKPRITPVTPEVPLKPLLEPLRPFKPLDAKSYLSDMWRITTELRAMVTQFESSVVKYVPRHENLQDEEELGLILLLVD